ncbi:hypothetical protein ACH3XW_44230 [Acanthocheilonema viteae]
MELGSAEKANNCNLSLFVTYRSSLGLRFQVKRITMNIKVIVVALIIGVLLLQIDAGRSKSSRKKTTDRGDSSEITSSSSKNDDEDGRRREKNHEHEREQRMGEKKDRKHSSSSSEEDDKDEKNETAINLGNKMRQKRETNFKKEQHFKQSFLLPWMKRDIRAGVNTTEPSSETKRNEKNTDGKNDRLKDSIQYL